VDSRNRYWYTITEPASENGDGEPAVVTDRFATVDGNSATAGFAHEIAACRPAAINHKRGLLDHDAATDDRAHGVDDRSAAALDRNVGTGDPTPRIDDRNSLSVTQMHIFGVSLLAALDRCGPARDHDPRMLVRATPMAGDEMSIDHRKHAALDDEAAALAGKTRAIACEALRVDFATRCAQHDRGLPDIAARSGTSSAFVSHVRPPVGRRVGPTS